MKLVTFNIRCDFGQDKENCFSSRKKSIAAKIRKEQPDVICFQEVLPHVAVWLKENLEGYYVIGCGRDEKLGDEQVSVAYRRDTVNLISMDTFWLSGEPHVPGSRYDCQSICPRVCTGAVFSYIGNPGKEYLFRLYNIHLDHLGGEARRLGLELILKRADREPAFPGIPVILAGDFNAEPDSPELAVLERCSDFTNVTEGIGITYHGFEPEDTPERIDHIFAGRPFVCQNVEKWEDRDGEVWLSAIIPSVQCWSVSLAEKRNVHEITNFYPLWKFGGKKYNRQQKEGGYQMQAVKSLGKKKKEKRPKQPLGKRLVRYWPLYVMLLPALIYYALICYVPMAGSVLAFKDYSFNKGIWGSPWVGLKYFKTFFESYDAPRLILNTFRIGLIKCVLEFPFAIILALMLNEIRNMKFKKVTQTITYLPHFLSSVIIVTMLQRILAPDTGILNQIIAGMGGDGGTFFMMDAKYFLKILFSMDLWRNIGWDSIIYLAAISSVDTALYEAAEMDGCGKLKKMWHITLPGIRGTIGLLFIMGIGGLLSSGVDQIWLLRTPGNMTLADTLDVYVVRVGLQGGQFGYATAIGLIQGIVGLILVVISNKICKKITDVGLW